MNLLPGGDFEKKAKGAQEEELDRTILEAEGLNGVGLGSLLSWRTNIDGKEKIWEVTNSGLGKSLKLKVEEGKSVSFTSERFPIEPGAEYEFLCVTKAEVEGVAIAVKPECVVQRYYPNMGFRARFVCRMFLVASTTGAGSRPQRDLW